MHRGIAARPADARIAIVASLALFPCAPALAQEPLPSVRVDRIEVVQAVQDLDHTVPLIAEKTTVVRVFLSGDPVRSAWGTLAVKKSDSSPHLVASAEGIDITAYAALRMRRENWWGSLNFLLPPALSAERSLTLTLAGLTDSVGNSVFCENCTIFKRDIVLEQPLEMRLRVIALSYTAGNPPATFEPRQIDFDMLQSWLKRAYPISRLSFSVTRQPVNRPVPAPPGNTFECEVVNSQITEIRNQEVKDGTDQRTRYYGMVPDDGRPGSFFMRGCSTDIPEAPDPSIVASGPTGPAGVQFPWDRDQSWGDWYGGHEIGHTLGRWHAGPFAGYQLDEKTLYQIPFGSCFEAIPDRDFPYPGGQISMDDGSSVGFDLGDTSLGLFPTVIPGKVGHDMMSYCEQQWISRYTYVAIMDRLRAENLLPARPPASSVPVASAAPVRTAAAGGAPSAGAASSGPRASGQVTQSAPPMGQPAPVYLDGDFITIVGTANLGQQEATIDYVSRVSRAKVRAANPDSPVRLRAFDESGATIAGFGDIPVVFLRNSHSPPGQVRGVVEAVLPARSDLKAIELLIGGKVAARYEAPAQINLAPSELTTTPLVQMPATAAVPSIKALPHQLEWSAQAPDFNLSPAVRGTRYDIQASGDGGQTWLTLAVGLKDPNAQVDLSMFKDIPVVDVRVIANSGFESKVIAQRKIQH
jgi:hypothetical protein